MSRTPVSLSLGLLLMCAGCSSQKQLETSAPCAPSSLQSDLIVSDFDDTRMSPERVYVRICNVSNVSYYDVPWIIIHHHYPQTIIASGFIRCIAPHCEVTTSIPMPHLTMFEMHTLTLIVAPNLTLCRETTNNAVLVSGMSCATSARSDSNRAHRSIPDALLMARSDGAGLHVHVVSPEPLTRGSSNA